MPNKRVTMQDIADACGLSRNTVSKVFNGRGAVPKLTRDMILLKAQELGYGLPSVEQKATTTPVAGKSIALLTCKLPTDYHFATFFFTAFTDQVCRAGFNLKMYEISPDEKRQKKLPPHFNLEETAALIGIELFDKDYLDMMCRLGLPTVLIDAPAHASLHLMDCDFVSMENQAGIIAIMKNVLDNSAKTIGFVGDREHCDSFYERWSAYAYVMDHAGLPLNKDVCILAPDSARYGDVEWLTEQLDRMPFIPDAFVCCNDFLAMNLVTALKKRGLSIPQDVMVTGFDDIPQASIMDPTLTTVRIPGADIGRTAASVLLRRIENPDQPYTWTRVKTTPICRESTNKVTGMMPAASPTK